VPSALIKIAKLPPERRTRRFKNSFITMRGRGRRAMSDVTSPEVTRGGRERGAVNARSASRSVCFPRLRRGKETPSPESPFRTNAMIHRATPTRAFSSRSLASPPPDFSAKRRSADSDRCVLLPRAELGSQIARERTHVYARVSVWRVSRSRQWENVRATLRGRTRTHAHAHARARSHSRKIRSGRC